MPAIFKSLTVIVLLLITSFGLVQPAGAGVLSYGTAAWTNKPLPLMAGPGNNYDVLGEVAGEIRVRVERCSGRWCVIRTDAGKGWVGIDHLSFGQDPGTPFDGPEFKYATQRGGPGEVCLYTGANFTGSKVCSKSGFVVHDLVHYDLDNRFASISIEGKVSVTVCRDLEFKNYCKKYVESAPTLGKFLSHNISSYRVW